MQYIIETERILLRKYSLTDLHDAARMGSDPEVMRFTGEGMVDRAKMLDILENVILADYKAYGYGRWVMELKSTGEYMGFCGLKYLPDIQEVDLGYRMFPRFWGQGYATEAAQATLDYGFEVLGLKRIIGQAFPENVASVRVLEKLGMKFEGTSSDGGPEWHIFAVNRP
ncbi:MAG: GNAT family N-acetyltransferase [Bacteroidia bacterium]|nr:GNAT family N-acetyltransferase [Bacteroidia bacterium]